MLEDPFRKINVRLVTKNWVYTPNIGLKIQRFLSYKNMQLLLDSKDSSGVLEVDQKHFLKSFS